MTRKLPFSGKAKKSQLSKKRQSKKDVQSKWNKVDEGGEEESKLTSSLDSMNVRIKPSSDLKTMFPKEPKWLIEKRKKDAFRPFDLKDVDKNSIYIDGLGRKENELGMPKRPVWTKETSKEELESLEENEFNTWLQSIYENNSIEELNYFEHNLQVWRQLWRTIEKSDVLIYLVDARFPILHFNHHLYDYITHEKHRQIILCFNKCDLIPCDVLKSWIDYFQQMYPSLLFLPCSSVLPSKMKKKKEYQDDGNKNDHKVEDLYRAFYTQFVDTLSQCCMFRKDKKDKNIKAKEEEMSKQIEMNMNEEDKMIKNDDHDYVMLGIIGDPNVGKSSFINYLFNKVVVSHSPTPGHTKHFQTLFLPFSSSSICLCDCPGITFPKKRIPKPIQILFGSYPIAQTREPYSCLRYLIQHLPMTPSSSSSHEPILNDSSSKYVINHQIQHILSVYQLKHLKDEEDDEWSPYSIAEAFANQKGFHVKGGRHDVYRAANLMLRNALNGHKTILYYSPPTENTTTAFHDMNKKKKEEEEKLESSSSITDTTKTGSKKVTSVNVNEDEEDASEENEEETYNPFNSLIDEEDVGRVNASDEDNYDESDEEDN